MFLLGITYMLLLWVHFTIGSRANSLSGSSLWPWKAAGPQLNTSPLTLLTPLNSAQEKGKMLKSITWTLVTHVRYPHPPKKVCSVTSLLQNFPTALYITCTHIALNIFLDLFNEYIYVLN